MGRGVRQLAVLITAVLLLATGCRDSDGTSGSAGASTSSSTTSFTDVSTTAVPVDATTTTATGQPTTGPTAPSGTNATSPSTAATPATSTTASANSAVATGEGWRLVVTRPTARATIGPTVTICYEITGTTREPDVALEVTVLRPVGAPVRVDAAVGRGSVTVALPSVTPGAYDLRIQLIANGVRVSGLAVTIPVTITAGGPAGSCP